MFRWFKIFFISILYVINCFKRNLNEELYEKNIWGTVEFQNFYKFRIIKFLN